MEYAQARPETEWSRQFRAIMATDPSCVTDTHLKDLFSDIRAELWPLDDDILPAESDPLMCVVRFCRGVPAIIAIMGDVSLHLKDEMSWAEIAQVIKEG